MKLTASAYAPNWNPQWDIQVDMSCNGTFLHRRGFMEYHADRFSDASALVLDEDDKIVALFPANRVGTSIVSHGGLTYGGLLYTPSLKQAACPQALECALEHYRGIGATSVIYKAVPTVFRRIPSEEDLYALTRCGATLVRRDVSTVVDLQREHEFSHGKKWSIKRGNKIGLQVSRQRSPTEFHSLLTEVQRRHEAAPVHTLDELCLLMDRFPDEIALYEARAAGALMAGTLVFDFKHTVHTQYSAVSTAGRECRALDFLLADLIRNTYADRLHFSFGISTEQGGMVLNEGLISQKEGFGGSSRCHDFYEIKL